MGRRKKGQPLSGWINLDKPAGIGSTKALARVRKFLDAQKAGHAGTLDPLASGILPIALGEATKVIPYIQDADKTYSFTVKWGEATDTEDSEGQIIATSEERPTREQIERALPAFIGEITQIPPKYSAIKIDGQRAYDLARAGEDVEMKSRTVHIHELALLAERGQEAEFRVTCGKGTYVRALARDVALKLGTYSHITALRREAVGHFTLDGAISLEILENMDHSAALKEILQPLQAPLDDIPALPLKENEVVKLRNGQSLSFISKGDFARLPQNAAANDPVLATLDGTAVALVEIEGASVNPFRVFNI